MKNSRTSSFFKFLASLTRRTTTTALIRSQKSLGLRFRKGRGESTEDWGSFLSLDCPYCTRYIDVRHASLGIKHLPAKVREFIYIAVTACTNHIHSPTVCAHLRAALTLEASHAKLMELIDLTYLVGIRTVNLGEPGIQKLLEGKGIVDEQNSKLQKQGQKPNDNSIKQCALLMDTLNTASGLEVGSLEVYNDSSSTLAQSGVLESEDGELITCVCATATCHLYVGNAKTHMRNALKLGSTLGDIMEMLEIARLAGIHGVASLACDLLTFGIDIGLDKMPKDETATNITIEGHGSFLEYFAIPGFLA
jgi:alkylhydroperoxidase/carboxymuconolactone decarboxylase family protein YurZ